MQIYPLALEISISMVKVSKRLHHVIPIWKARGQIRIFWKKASDFSHYFIRIPNVWKYTQILVQRANFKFSPKKMCRPSTPPHMLRILSFQIRRVSFFGRFPCVFKQTHTDLMGHLKDIFQKKCVPFKNLFCL